MMYPAILSVFAGTSGRIGLLVLVAYFFYAYQIRKMEQSVRRTIEGESGRLFGPDKVVDILRAFETPESRLTSLKQLVGVDDRAAKKVYAKILRFCSGFPQYRPQPPSGSPNPR